MLLCRCALARLPRYRLRSPVARPALRVPCPDLRRGPREWFCGFPSRWDSIRTALGIRHRLLQRKSNGERGAGAGVALQRAAEHLDALAHTAQSVALVLQAAAAVIFNLEAAGAVLLLETQSAGVGASVTNYVGDGLAHRQREHTLVQRRKSYFCGLTFCFYSCGFKGGSGLREFGVEAASAIAANGVANLGERLARNLLDLSNFVASALRIAIHQLAGEFGFQNNDRKRMPEHVVKVAGDALALGHFSEVLNFFVRHAQLRESAVALGKINVAAADDYRESTRIKEKPARQVEDLGFDRGEHNNAGHQGYGFALRLHAERHEGAGENKERGGAAVIGGTH